jgi:hypothetical protein
MNKKQSVVVRSVAVLGAVVGLLMAFWALHLNGYTTKRLVSTVVQPLTFWKVEDCQSAPCIPGESLVLSPNARSLIGNNTVDIYPLQSLYAYYNGLNWDPRPILASYSAYSPPLDNEDAAFYASNKAPEFIIWDVSQGILGIDGRNIIYDEPKTMTAILTHYRLAYNQASVLVLKRLNSPISLKETASYSQSLSWNEWVSVPNGLFDTDYISYKPNINQTIGALIFRPTPVNIELQRQDGTTATFRVVPANMSQGLLISQTPFSASDLVKLLSGEATSNPITKFRLLNPSTGSLSLRDGILSQ